MIKHCILYISISLEFNQHFATVLTLSVSLYVRICHHLSNVSLLEAFVDFFFSVCVGGLSGGPPA